MPTVPLADDRDPDRRNSETFVDGSATLGDPVPLAAKVTLAIGVAFVVLLAFLPVWDLACAFIPR